MSRLKGADLGIPAGAFINTNRGAWTATPSPAYAVGDIVQRAGSSYLAIVAPGAVDPTAPPGAAVEVGAVGSTDTGNGRLNATGTQVFTVNSTITISAIQVQALTGGPGVPVNATMGIAADSAFIGKNPSQLVYLASGSSPAIAAGSWGTVPLSTSITLVPGTVYRLVDSSGQVATKNTSPQLSGVVATAGSLYYDDGNANWVVSAATMLFRLNGVAPNPWSAIAAAGAPGTPAPAGAMNYRGPWVSGNSYAVNDVVSRALALYVASVIPGPSDPSTPPGAETVGYGVTGATPSGDGGVYAQGQDFTLAAPITLDTIRIYVANPNIAQTFGITASAAATSYLTIAGHVISGTITPTAAGWVDVPLGFSVTLPAGSYTFVQAASSVASSTLPFGTDVPVVSNGSKGELYIQTTTSGATLTVPPNGLTANSPSTYMPFQLKGVIPNPWQKVADNGIVVPAGTLNYRGAWASVSTYAANDTVKRSTGLYRALTAVGANQDPAVVFTPSFTEQAGTVLADAGYGFQGAYTQAEQFTLTAPVTIDSFKIPFGGGQGSNGDVKAGIATSIGTVESAITFLSVGGVEVSGTIPIASQLSQKDAVVLLPAVVTIPAGTYYLVLKGVNGGGAYSGAIVSAGSAALTGISALGGLSYATAPGGAYATITSQTPFQLGAGQLSYWEKIADDGIVVPAGTMNYRGVWSSAVPYQPNDVVLRALALYLAVTAPAIGADPTAPASLALVGQCGNGTPSNRFDDISAQAFTVNAVTVVKAIELVAFTSDSIAAGLTVGIASDFASGGTPVYLGQGITVASGAGLWQRIVLDAAVTLVPGTTYRLMAAGGAQYEAAPAVLTGAVGGVGNILYGSPNYANVGTPGFMSFRLDGASPWVKIANASRQETVNAVAAATGAVILPDVDIDTIHRLVLTGNVTLTFPPVSAGKSFTLALVQDATGSRTVTWPASVQWAGGTAPTLTTTANKKDVISFLSDDGVNWSGRIVGQNY